MFRWWWPCLVLHLLLCQDARGAQRPPEFVNLRDVAPEILQDIRYAGPDNFTGQRVPGYDANECVLKRPVAEALKQVHAELRQQSLGLKVYDCYRPTRATQAFLQWIGASSDRKSTRLNSSRLGISYAVF